MRIPPTVYVYLLALAASRYERLGGTCPPALQNAGELTWGVS
jgi:hypothetical protein